MPSTIHDAMNELLRSHPAVALRLAETVGIPIESEDWRWVGGKCEFCDPACTGATYRADVVLVAFSDPAGKFDPIEALNLEPQFGRDRSKYISLPIYATGAHTVYGCRTEQALVSPVDDVLCWYRDEVFGKERRHLPYLIGPRQVPPVLDLGVARADPAWAAITAALHSRSAHACEAAIVALRACVGLPHDRLRQYTRLVMAGLTKEQQRAVRPHLPPELDEPLSDFERECYMFVRGEEQGKVEGKRGALLTLLEARGLVPTQAQLEAIQACDDLDRLERWLRAVLSAGSVAELLALDA